jgi:hypothetical protein
MSVEAIARTIQLMLAPVVMVTSCALLVGGMLTRYTAINDLMRALTRERLELLRGQGGALSVVAMAGDAFKEERLHEIDTQLPSLLRQHELIHHGALATYLAISLFVLSMFVIALAAGSSSAALATTALVVFLLGTAALLVGVLLIGLEIRISNQAVRYQVERVIGLGK